ERRESRPALVTLSTMAVVLALSIFAVGAVYVDRYQDSPRFARMISENTPVDEEAAIGSYAYFRPSMVFYTDHAIREISSVADVQAFFADHPGSTFLFPTDVQYQQPGASLPSDVKVLDTRRRFLQKGHVLLLGRVTPESATARLPAGDGESAAQ